MKGDLCNEKNLTIKINAKFFKLLVSYVQYEDDFTAGIYNPLPIRFRGSSSAVHFFCSTTLSPAMNGKCQRKLCTWNEYSKKENHKE